MTIFSLRKVSLNSLIRLLDSILLSYSNIFFSNSRLLGAVVLITTLLYPQHGISGLLGALFSNTWAYLFGMDRQSIRSGLFGFNGALVGLAAGFFFSLTGTSLLFLMSATLFLTLLTVFLNNIFHHYLGLPAMSMPFNITAWLITLAGITMAHLAPAQNLPVIDMQLPVSPAMSAFLSAFSAILFQPNPLSGLIVATVILLYSRIAFTLMTAGFMAAYYFQTFSGLDINIITEKYLGFNYMFSTLAIGGIFVIPNTGSLLLGLLASTVTVSITAACVTLFPSSLSPLAFPFNITVYIFLYALRLRAHPSLNVTLSANSALSPEENLRKHHEILKQWKKSPITIALPFHGQWKVTQGIDGQFTHKEDWWFAYDFQAVDSYGRTYRSTDTPSSPLLEDYYSYGLPVLSPANGKVHSLKNDVPDNQIGRVNTEDNWGNYIIIEHAPDFYSCIAHLKHGSIKVMPGQEVKKGEIIAACGNSGRSPYPHIHLQFQRFPQVGSPSISFEFSNLIVIKEQQTFIPQGIVPENSLVRNMTPASAYEELFPYSLDKTWTYKYISGKKERLEHWHLDLDFYGNTILTSSPKTTKLYFQLSDGVLSIKAIEGDMTTGLALMGSLISEVPFTTDTSEMTWTNFGPMDYGIPHIIKAGLDVVSLFGFNLMVSRSYTAMTVNGEMTLNIQSSLHLKIPFFAIPLKKQPEAEMVFKRRVGLKVLKRGSKIIEMQ